MVFPLSSFNQLLSKPADNVAIALVRIALGFLLFLESIGAIFTGWVKETFVEPSFTFTFIGFEFLSCFPGPQMYLYYVILGILGLFIMFGYQYRTSVASFGLLWTIAYWMQKSNYNNHYYLVVLLCFLMFFIPANRRFSIDAKLNPSLQSDYCPSWCHYILILQIWIVYTYAGMAKINSDWLAGKPISIWFSAKSNYFLIGPVLAREWFQTLVVYGGLLFDLFHIPFMFWKKTRLLVFVIAVFFHLFNAAVFHIGIFPFLMISLYILFFSPEQIRKVFTRVKEYKPIIEDENYTEFKNAGRNFIIPVLILYFTVQLILPIRHHFIQGDVNWTEEGHRMSWRMMLRSKTGNIQYFVENQVNGKRIIVPKGKYLTRNQIAALATKPDMIWQFARRLDKIYTEKYGNEVKVFVDCKVGLNGRKRRVFVDPETDLSKEPWSYLHHADWLKNLKDD